MRIKKNSESRLQKITLLNIINVFEVSLFAVLKTSPR